MMRVLLIDGNRAFAESVAMSCITDGIAVRLAETLCEGVRYMMDGPVSVVLIDSALMRFRVRSRFGSSTPSRRACRWRCSCRRARRSRRP